MINKEAIELLGNSIEGTVYPKDGTSHYKVNPHIFHQALALLKEQPPASEAEIKKYIEMDKYKSQQSILATKNYNRICKQVEKLEASRKELLAACERGHARLLELGQRESMDTPKILKAAIKANK